MTLVVSVVTDKAVIQAADRRLVWLEKDGSTRLRDDDRNKVVMLGKRIIFGYAGLAELGPRREKTDDWLAATLHEGRGIGDQSDILDFVAMKATERLNHGRFKALSKAQLGHEFAACGWARFPDSELKEFRPYVAWISNLRAPDSSLLSEPSPELVVGFAQLAADDDWNLVVSGQQLPADHEQDLRQSVAATNGDLYALADVLIGHIRMAAEENKTIGKGVLLSVIPRAAVRAGDGGALLISGGPIDEVPSFYYVPADENELRVYGPTVVSPGGGVFTNLTAGPIGSPGFPPAES